jgi:hypothetical protein
MLQGKHNTSREIWRGVNSWDFFLWPQFSYFSFPITYTTEQQQPYCNRVSTVAMSKFTKDCHCRSALRKATAAFKSEVAASATLLGIWHKILPFYYIMYKLDITYCLTSEGRGGQGYISTFRCTIYTYKFMYEHNRFFSFLMCLLYIIYRFILYTSLCVLPLNPHLVAT